MIGLFLLHKTNILQGIFIIYLQEELQGERIWSFGSGPLKNLLRALYIALDMPIQIHHNTLVTS